METEDTTYLALRMFVKTFEDIQRARIRVENRLTAYGDRGLGQFGGTELVLGELHKLEEMADRDLVREYLYVAPPGVVNWQQQTHGIGEHQMALFLGTVGDPLMAYPKTVVKVPEHLLKRNAGRKARNTIPDGPPVPRTAARLRAYCGFGAPLRRRRATGTQTAMSGDEAKALGNTRAKVIVWNMARSTIIQGSPKYRAIYDAAKADKLHLLEPWRPAHAEAHAYRLVSKAIILDIWLAAGGTPAPVPTTPVKRTRRKAVA